MRNSDDGDAPDGTDPFGSDPDFRKEPEEVDSSGERSARFPPPPSIPDVPGITSPPPWPSDSKLKHADEHWHPVEEGSRESQLSELHHRPSVLDALRQSRTTFSEISEVAQRLSSIAPGLTDARKTVRQAVFSFAVGLTLALLVALVFAGGTLRLVLGILAGTGVAALGVFGTLRVVSRLAARFGARALPGPSWLWVATVMALAVTGTAGFSLSVWKVTTLARAGLTRLAPTPAPSDSAAPPADSPKGRADAKMKRGRHIGLNHGVLYVPKSFESADGRFDLVIHYHGNVELVKQSIDAAKINALVCVVNYGDGAGAYSKPLRDPFAFDRLLGAIETHTEKKLGLRSAQIRRIALSSWSAGFASAARILGSRTSLDRVDTLLLMDSLHGTYAPGSKTEIYSESIKPFVTFARRAMAGRKLMILTHSAIETEGYPSTTLMADGLLERVSLKRQPVTDDSASPPPVDLKVAKWAFPENERNWLRVVSTAHKGNFYVYGCAGNGKGDHIAHLAQMSVAVLPPLRERWK